jgi:hypothetical protein
VTAVARTRSVVAGEAPELRPGALEDDEVGQPGEHVDVVAVDGHHRRAHLAPGTAEGVVVRLPADGDPLPAVGLDGDPRTGDRRLRAGEVVGQPDAELLR